MIFRLATLAAAALMLAGCAVGNQYDYRTGRSGTPIGDASVAVAVADFRGYVLSGDKAPDFVGLQRGGFGNPFDVTTASGAPLAADMTALLANSFTESGRRVETIALEKGDGVDAALDAFDATTADRLLLVEMREWKSDVYAAVTIHYDLTAKVFDRRRALLVERRVNGVDGSQVTALLPGNNDTKAVSEAGRRLGQLLSAEDVTAALR